jgi:serine-type D-Ala-D-Ala carboxypeptidase/endopeptidase
MLNRRRLLFTALPGALIAAGSARAAAPMTDVTIDALMGKEIAETGPGMVAAILDSSGHPVIRTQGTAGDAADRALDGDTLFDIGSLTKLFTAVALADMVARGEMAMQDSLAKYLPPDVQVPDFAGKPITLLDVVTYSPGLPGWPSNTPALSEDDKPFPDYPTEKIYQALAATKLAAAPGTQYVYSNFGYGLLGLALARRAKLGFEEMIVSRVCKPLGMDSTCITVPAAMQARVAPGHNSKHAKVTGWTLPEAFAGAGAFRSTANDLAKFLEAAMGQRRTSLSPAFASLLVTRRPADRPDTRVGAGWFITSGHDDELVWKDGSTLGYTSFIGYSRRSRAGIVLLANGECGEILPPLGKHMLNPDFPLTKA